MTEPRRILFVISCFRVSNTGQGGHYHSLRTVAEALAESGDDVQIVSVGDFSPAALEGVGVPYRHLDAGGLSLSAARARFDPPPTHVHAFDRRAVFFAREISRRHRAKLYVTKPGGPNKRYHPFAEDIFAFSAENRAWLEQDPRLKQARIHFTPQRVRAIMADTDRLASLQESYPFDGMTVLRIARVGPYYRRSIDATLGLAQGLRARGIKARAFILGSREDAATVAELGGLMLAPDVLCTEPCFTRSAAQLLGIGDFVVGTGRGLMEAMMAGKPVFCPVAGEPNPVHVTASNIDALHATNFSERSVAPADRDGLEALFLMASSEGERSAAMEEARRLAAERFNIAAALPIYHSAYDAPQTGRRSFVDDIMLTGGGLYAAVKR
jgi:glycosyltransferase involved in cell wall biosynthesis